MKKSCMIKSHSKGLTLILDDSVSFEDLVMDVCRVFAKSKDFFGKEEMILSIEGRNLDSRELLIVIEAIELNSNIKVSLILDESEIRDVRTVGAIDRFYFDRMDQNAKIIRGNIKSGDIVTSDTGAVIIGDVKKNAQVIAAGNVCVLGKLEGSVRAGEPDNSNCFIVANKLYAKEATIGGVTKEINVKYRGFKTAKKSKEPVVIKLLHGYFHAEPLSGGLVTQDE